MIKAVDHRYSTAASPMKNVSESFYTWYKATLRNQKYRWLLVVGSLLYLVSPIDIAPDFIPLIGWIDDGIVATLLVTEVSQMALEFLRNRKRPITTADSASLEDPVITVDAH